MRLTNTIRDAFIHSVMADEAKATKVQLPAVANIVADFTKAGWPKSEKKEGVAA